MTNWLFRFWDSGFVRWLLAGACWLSFTPLLRAQASPVEYLSAHAELILSATQDWGTLGFDVAAHQPLTAGQPLRLGENSFTKGLGHHANGAIVIALDGEFASFDATVGLQPCGGSAGSVIFRVFVDGQKAFDSGIVRAADAAKPVHVGVQGAQELRLEAGDAGDGINCDMANWADARLTRTPTDRVVRSNDSVDMARFARVVTWDPNRKDGCRASRIEEYRAEDLFLETDVSPNADGTVTVPGATNGWACIGLQWLNRRTLRELSLRFADAAQLPATNKTQMEGWFGESAWQGNWKPLRGTWQVAEERLTFQVGLNGEPPGLLPIQKVRWIFPAANRPIVLRGLTAHTRSRWDRLNLRAEIEHVPAGARGEVNVINGEILGSPSVAWDLSRPLQLTVRYSRPGSVKADATVVQFRLPTGTVGVAVDDLLSNECVYVPDGGLFVAREPALTTLAAYKQKIAGRQTILEEVRALPDQTIEQAMAKAHHDAQREGPVLLSLACDNTKFVVEREGTVRFQVQPPTTEDWFATSGEVRPQFGTGTSKKLTRYLEGGWLPIPVVTVEQDGVVYRQRIFVAPTDSAEPKPTRLNRASVCVVDITATNQSAQPAAVSVALNFLIHSRPKQPARFTPWARGQFVVDEAGPIGLIATNGAMPLQSQVDGGVFTLTGMLPPQQGARCVVYLPSRRGELLSLPEASPLRRSVEEYWQAMLAPAMQVETPEVLLNDLIRSSQVRCLIAARNEADGARIAPWIAAMSYGPLESEAQAVIRGMDFLGHGDFARRGLDFFIHRYHTNGFLTTGYTTFGTGWHLWTLGEHFRLVHDTNWLRQVAPAITRSGHWIVRQTAKTKTLNTQGEKMPEYGLMPPGVLADWNAFAYHYCLNGYYHAALRELGAALKEIGDPNAAAFERAALELRENILRAYRWTQEQSPALALRNGTWIPAYPSQVHSPGKLADFFPGQDAGRSWAYDVELGAHQLVATGVFDPPSREVTRLLEHMEDVQFLAEGWFDYPAEMNRQDWFNLGGFSKVQPYYCRNGEIYALRDDVKPFVRSYFNTLAAMLNPEVMTFWEHFHHSGAWDKTHETGYFLQQTRFMLVQERGDELWLAPLITSNWLKPGLTVAVRNAPTRFGKVSYRITSRLSQDAIEASIDGPAQRAPRAMVLRLRHPHDRPIRSVSVEGQPQTAFDPASATIRISPSLGVIHVQVTY